MDMGNLLAALMLDCSPNWAFFVLLAITREVGVDFKSRWRCETYFSDVYYLCIFSTFYPKHLQFSWDYLRTIHEDKNFTTSDRRK